MEMLISVSTLMVTFVTTDPVGVFNLGNIDDFYQAEGIRLSYATDSLAVSIAATNGVGAQEERAYICHYFQ